VLEERCLLTVIPQGVILAPTPVQNTPFTSETVATFISPTDPNPADFSALIHWGDGSTSSGTIQPVGPVSLPGPGAFLFQVLGDHTYAQQTNGSNLQVQVDITDSSDLTTSSAFSTTIVADSALTGTGPVSFSGTEGTGLVGQTLATFSHIDSIHSSSAYQVSVNWGDATSLDTSATLTITPGGPGTPDSIVVTGNHTYAEKGMYIVTVGLIDDAGTSATVTTQAIIHDAGPLTNDLTSTINATVGSPLTNVLVAAFSDPNTLATAGDFTAQVSWGGTTEPGIVSQLTPGVFAVTSSYTFTSPGIGIPVVTTVTDVGGTLPAGDTPTTFVNTGDVSANVSAAALVPIANPVVVPEGVSIPAGTPIGTFADLSGAQPVANYTANSFVQFPGATSTTPLTITQNGTTNTFTLATAMDTTFAIGSIDEGVYSYTLQVGDTSGATATTTGVLTVNDAPLTAAATQPVVNAFQQTPLVGVQVAGFTDGNTAAPLGDFTATIDWGDGTLDSAGQLIQPGGVGTAFFVLGNHTYAQPTTPPALPYVITVAIKDEGGSSLTTTTSANVTASTITGMPVTITATEGQPVSNVVVAYFSDSGTAGPLSSYSATIAWGTGLPGSTTIGAVVPLGGSQFAVEGSYTYPEESPPGLPYSITVTIDHNGLAATTVVSQAQVADAPISGAAVPVFATEGQPFVGTVAVFLDSNPNGAATDFTATITWGNGDSTAGTVVADGTSFLVTSADPVSGKGYAYPEEGSYAFSVTVKDVGGAQFTAFQTATVADAPVTASGLTLGVAPNPIVYESPLFSGAVATFTDADPNGAMSDYSASINWGDGTVTPGTISLSQTVQGQFVVNGTHQYAQSTSPYQVTVSIKDAGGATALAITSITISDSLLTAGPTTTIAATEGQPFNAQVGTFIDANPSAPPSQFAATINWGDTVSSTGVIGKQANGSFTVTGSHTYDEESASGTPYAITVLITDIGGTAPGSVTATATATVADAPLYSQGSPINGVEGIGLNPSPSTVATFTDADPNGTASDYTALINWGDGSVATTGTIVQTGTSPNGSTFNVNGAHTYAEEGTYQTQVTITDVGGSQTLAVGNAVIADAPLTASAPQPPVNVTEAIGFTTPVAMFVDANPGGTVSDFSATIHWGDGTPDTSGTVSQPGGIGTAFVVSGTHNYADSGVNGGTGLFPITVSVRDVGGSTLGIPNTANVADVPLTVTGRLNPASDSGVSNSDNITNNVQPAFLGTTSEPDATVTLYAQPRAGGSTFVIGQGTANSNDAWSITSNQALADGSYTITAIAVDRFGHTVSATTTIVSDLVIDTVGPKVTDVFFDRLHGQIQVVFQDYGGPGNAGVGLDLATVFDANNYSLTKVLHPRLGAFVVNVISVTPGTTSGAQVATLSINGGQYLRGGFYDFTIHSVSPTDRTGVQDIAGNALDGEFYGYFPSGNSHPGGDFVAELDAIHHTIFAPKTVIGMATPVSPPGALALNTFDPQTVNPGKLPKDPRHPARTRVDHRIGSHAAKRVSHEMFDRALHQVTTHKLGRS